MNTNDAARQGPSVFLSLIALCVVLLAMFGAFLFGKERARHGVGPILQDSVKKARLVSDMQANLLASAEAEKSAVMAETDEASAAFATESRRASGALEKDRSELARLIDIGARPDEVRTLREFSDCWTKYREVDDEILDLAVENTNLKAQRLSFGPAPAALDRMQTALDTLVADSGASAEAAASAKRAYQALAAAFKIHALEGRHIAESGDAEMDKLDAEMKMLDGRVTAALDALAAASGDAGKAAIENARAAYADFQRVHSEVLVLSRRNSNVRSLAISLGQKRKIMAQCEEHLNALQEAVQPVFEATR